MPRLTKDGPVQVGGRTVQVPGIGQLSPDTGLVEGTRYYRDVAEVMLPHLRGRPLNFQRFPGRGRLQRFWQQGADDHFPGRVTTVTVEQ